MAISVHLATPDEAPRIAEMAIALTEEIMERTGVRHFNVNLPATTALCRRLMTSGSYIALIAAEDDEPLGYAGLCESHALYTEGPFGIIQEFYVVPAARSAGVGGALLQAARAHARSKQWKRLELCTPPLPDFQRTLAFYERNGFEVTGGRKMKALL